MRFRRMLANLYNGNVFIWNYIDQVRGSVMGSLLCPELARIRDSDGKGLSK